ncbi:DUF3105 domain-containing protein [Patescibacteria group bacterium]|nr:DUF3105 domain-containing protein [Patescibacteria group bacterium]
MSSAEKEQERTRKERAKKIKKLFWRFFVLVAVFAVGYGLVRWIAHHQTNLPGVGYPEVGREHIALRDPNPRSYNSNPPTSGPHFSSPANWGAYDFEVRDEIFLHNLEHGGVWISYKPGVPQTVVDELKKIAEDMNTKIVLGPRSKNDTDIAVAAWTRLLKFNLVGGALSASQKEDIKNFAETFVNKGPEYIPDMGGGIDPKTVQ